MAYPSTNSTVEIYLAFRWKGSNMKRRLGVYKAKALPVGDTALFMPFATWKTECVKKHDFLLSKSTVFTKTLSAILLLWIL